MDPQQHATRTHYKRLIREAAAGCFAESGYKKTNVAEIAAAAEMSAGNLYRFYGNKKTIGLAVYAQFLAGLREMAEAAVPPLADGAEAHIRALLSAEVMGWARKLMREPKTVELAELALKDGEGATVLRPHDQWRRGALEAALFSGAASGELAAPDPEGAACALLRATRLLWSPDLLCRFDIAMAEEALGSVLDLAFRGLRA